MLRKERKYFVRKDSGSLRRTVFRSGGEGFVRKAQYVERSRAIRYAETLYGPRTSRFCNPLRYNTMQNNLVRGPIIFRGTANIDFCNNLYFNKIQIWHVRGPYVILNRNNIAILNTAALCHPERSRRRSEGSGHHSGTHRQPSAPDSSLTLRMTVHHRSEGEDAEISGC